MHRADDRARRPGTSSPTSPCGAARPASRSCRRAACSTRVEHTAGLAGLHHRDVEVVERPSGASTARPRATSPARRRGAPRRRPSASGLFSVCSARMDSDAEQREAGVDHRRELAREDRDVLELDPVGPKPGILTSLVSDLPPTSARSRWACSPSGAACSTTSCALSASSEPSTSLPALVADLVREGRRHQAAQLGCWIRRRRSSSLVQRSSASSSVIVPVLTSAGERLVHRDHAVLPAGLQHRVDLVDLALTDEVADRRRRDQHLGARPRGPCRRRVGSSCWVQIPCSDDGELHADLLLLVRGEHVDDAVDRLRRVLRVQRREHEVTGLRRGQRGRDRLEVTHLTDEDDVGVLAQHVLAARRRTSACPRRPRAG